MPLNRDSVDIYSRVNHSESEKRETFLIFYKDYINVPLYKKDKARYLKTLGSVETLLKDIKDINKNMLILCDSGIDREVFLTLFSKKERLTSNKYVNAAQIYDVYWDRCGRDNIHIDDSDVMYSTQEYSEDVLCVYTSDDTYVRGVGPIISSLVDSRNNRHNYRGENLITWIFYRGTEESMLNDKDFKIVLNYFRSNNDNDDFMILDLNKSGNGIVIPSGEGINKIGNTLKDIY